MEFHRGKAIPSSEQDRLYVKSENYVYDFYQMGKAHCPSCKSDCLERAEIFSQDTAGYLKIETKCHSCAHEWKEVYALAGCTDYVFKPKPKE